MPRGGGCCGIAYDIFVSLVRQGGGGFRPLYRGRFLGSLATRYVGHSRRVYQKWAGAADVVDGTSKDLLVTCCETNVASFTTDCLTRPVM